MKSFVVRYRTVAKIDDFLQNNSIENSSKMLIQIFSSRKDPNELSDLLNFLKKRFQDATIVGVCSTASLYESKILFGDTTINFIIFESSTIKSNYLNRSDDDFQDGKNLSKSVWQDHTKAIILYSTFKDINKQRFLKGVETNSKNTLICGGVSADVKNNFQSYLIYNEKIIKNGSVAISLAGEKLSAFNLYEHSQKPISKEFYVSTQVANVIKSLDDLNASKLYLHYLNKSDPKQIPYYSLEFPFITKRADTDLTLQINDVDENGNLIFGSNIKKDEKLRLSFFDLESAKSGINTLEKQLNSQNIESIFVFGSIARELFIKDIHRKEISILKNFAKPIGFCSVGEFFSNQNRTLFLNHSLSILALSESQRKIQNRSKKLDTKTLKDDPNFDTIKTLSHIARLSSNELELLNKKLQYRVNESVREIRKKESIMIHNNRLAQLGEMLGLIAHQWRQPLSAISATATGMEVKIELGKWDEEYIVDSLRNIEKYVSHLSETIDDFTNFFKPTKKKVKTTLKEIVQKALFISSSLLSKEEVEVYEKYTEQMQILTYPNEIVQVVLNLIKNSVNALVNRDIPTKEIYIQTYQKESKFFIEISDNAGGIESRYLDKIFEPYFSTKSEKSSMGLGLYMSKFIIEESCGGELRVENGKLGAKFTIILDSVNEVMI
jgi:signal transduction histidine kinase